MATLVEDMYTVNETDGSRMICVNLVEGVLERTITVNLNTAPGTAIGEINNTLHKSVDLFYKLALGKTWEVACASKIVTFPSDDHFLQKMRTTLLWLMLR